MGIGPVLDPEDVRQAFAVRDLGFDTVSLAWAVYKLFVEGRRAALNTLSEQLKSKRFPTHAFNPEANLCHQNCQAGRCGAGSRSDSGRCRPT